MAALNSPHPLPGCFNFPLFWFLADQLPGHHTPKMPLVASASVLIFSELCLGSGIIFHYHLVSRMMNSDTHSYCYHCVELVTQSCLTLWPHGLESARFLYPWDSSGKNTGVGSYPVFQGIFPTQGSNQGLLHCRQILHCLSHQGSLAITVITDQRYF